MAGTAPATVPLEAQLGHWLRAAARRSRDRFAALLAGEGVTAAEWELLRVLYEAGAVPPSVLAARAGLTRGAVTRLVDRLRAKRLAVRAAGASADRRFQTIALTGAGAKLVRALAARADRGDAALFDALDAAQRAALLRMLRAVAGAGQGEGHDPA